MSAYSTMDEYRHVYRLTRVHAPFHTHVHTLVCTHAYMSIHMFDYMPTHVSIHLSVHMSTHISTHMSMHMRMHMFVHMSTHVSIHMSLHMSVHMPIHMPVHMLVCMSTHMSCTSMASRHRVTAKGSLSLCTPRRLPTHVRISRYTYMHVYINSCTVCVSLCVFVCVCARACVRMCVCVRACACAHASARTHKWEETCRGGAAGGVGELGLGLWHGWKCDSLSEWTRGVDQLVHVCRHACVLSLVSTCACTCA